MLPIINDLKHSNYVEVLYVGKFVYFEPLSIFWNHFVWYFFMYYCACLILSVQFVVNFSVI